MSDWHISVDHSQPLAQQSATGHNRWHPDIPPVLKIEGGDRVDIDTLDSFDGQLTPKTTHDDLGRASLKRLHPLTGPIFINGADPGDLLSIKIEAVNYPN